jgi:hypothetical protein
VLAALGTSGQNASKTSMEGVMTNLALACALLIAVSTLAQAQDTGVQFKVPPLEGKPFTTSRGAGPQNAPNGRIRVSVNEFGTSYPNVSGAAVSIRIDGFKDGQNGRINDIREVKILDTQGRPIEFRDNNPREIGPTGRGSASSMYSATYELLNPSKIHSIGKVTFMYQGKEYDFDMKEPPPRVKQ